MAMSQDARLLTLRRQAPKKYKQYIYDLMKNQNMSIMSGKETYIICIVHTVHMQ